MAVLVGCSQVSEKLTGSVLPRTWGMAHVGADAAVPVRSPFRPSPGARRAPVADLLRARGVMLWAGDLRAARRVPDAFVVGISPPLGVRGPRGSSGSGISSDSPCDRRRVKPRDQARSKLA